MNREIAPGVHWLPNCLGREEPAGWMHIHAACYLAVGPERALLVDTGHPAHWKTISDTLDELLDGRLLDYVFPTHTEIPHAGNLERLLRRFPEAVVLGDVRDLHLFYPAIADRLEPRAAGEVVSLGGDMELEFVEPAIRDLPNTLWAKLAPASVLFVSDGFMLSHQVAEDGDEALHAPGECLLTTSELDWPPDLRRVTFVTERSIYWMRFAQPGEAMRRMRDAVDRHQPDLIAPTHSNVVAGTAPLLELMEAGWSAIAATDVNGRAI
jgi:hypothetical protein